MIDAADFVDTGLEQGYRFWSGVPCSYLTPFINYVLQDPRLTYVGAASEGEAVAISAGAHLAGDKSVVICQNSGLGNTVNPLTSLNHIFRIPSMLIVTHRGQPGQPDEPQHALMGRVMQELLNVIEVPTAPFPSERAEVAPAVAKADSTMESSGLPFAFVMTKGSVAAFPLQETAASELPGASTVEGRFTKAAAERPGRRAVIDAVREAAGPEVALIGTTGHIGRELFELGHRPNQLYVVGSMGCAAPLGLGVQLARPDQPVVVLDGDGAALMKLGAWGTIGNAQPKRFLHVLIDNEAHMSTGGQATVSQTMDFGAIAAACGYRRVWRCESIDDIPRLVAQALASDGPSLLHVKVEKEAPQGLSRPNVTPLEVKQQFMAWMGR